jgi:hypothetical protein
MPLPLNVCERDSGSCASDNPHLVGFVANSERNEIAMFTKCSNRLVDMSISVPGYNFIPAGVLPTHLDSSSDGCLVMGTNVGSCDITLLDAVGLARIALGREPDVDELSELVATLIPRRFDDGRWVPLGARPAEILSVPGSLSQAPNLDPDSPLEGICDPLAPASAYVSFPSCNLVAEIDLRTGHVLQSRMFLGEEDGEVTVIDTGITPVCPVECPAQFGGQSGVEFPEDLPLVDPLGPFPQAIEIALRPTPPVGDADPLDPSSDDPGGPGGFDQADETVEGQSLFVGGLGSDILFEIRISDTGVWEPVENQLRLAEASGIKRVRLSPPVNTPVLGSNFGQFLYVVAGDGSTRVVGRPIPRLDGVIGIECETQLDPNILPVTDMACVPVSEALTDGPPAERSGFARGPGIRIPEGDEVTDWMFRKVYAVGQGSGPFAEVGVTAIGVTSAGRAVYAMVNQQRTRGETTIDQFSDFQDPVGIMSVDLAPHSLWPSYDTVASIPRLQDELPSRTIRNDLSPTRYLAPTLRQVDATYARDPRASAQLDVVADIDQLGGGRLYDQDVARVVVHDYRAWTGGMWSIEWEGPVTNQSGTGQLYCANPGWQGGTCLVNEPDDARLFDTAASFCTHGVLAGDKLVVLGCRQHEQCGEGRRCLRETVAGGESTGICVSAQAYEERAPELRQVCANFIRDPCGEAHREFTITRAFQDELWIQSMDQPLISYLVDDGAGSFTEAQDRFICADEQPDGGCTENAECTALLGADAEWMCIDGRCRRPCENADECVLRRLPGPACFSEFVAYHVALRNQFRVLGPGGQFLTSLIEVDPDTQECRVTSDPERSRLMTSRLPVPASDDPNDPGWLAIPECPVGEVLPTDPNPCRITDARESGALFHQFRYEGEAVSALRFSNPVFSVVLDLSSLTALTQDIRGADVPWPAEFADFYRSRIPRNYRQEFRLVTGYTPFQPRILLEGRPATFPVRIVPAPQDDRAYVVDISGPGLTTSIRGQVVRVELTDQFLSDEAFIGVR